MNRSILIVICDFLLVSLLVFSTPDISKVTDQSGQRTVRLEMVTTNAVDSGGKDLALVMKLALDEERKNRDQLLSELTRSRTAITERERQARLFQQQLEARDQFQANLQQQVAAAQTNLEFLNQQLQSTSSEALLSKEKLAAMEAEARKQAERAAALQDQLAHLSSSNQMILTEKQQLAGRLQVAEVEKRHAAEQVVRMTEEVKVEREEKAKLAEGVKALASKSSELTQEIRENRPLTANTLFNEYLTNRVEARLYAARSGFLGGDAVKRKDVSTVLVTDGTNTFALCHVQDTPLWNPGTDWESLTGTLAHNLNQVPIRSLSFAWPDPRVALIPVTIAEARQLGCKVYRTSTEPFKFQDAVLVGAQQGYYGECRFEIDLSTPDYVRLDSNFIKGLFGKFNPSRGDLVFSKTGELLGVMANGNYCMMIRTFDASATFKFGQDVRAQRTGETLSVLYAQVSQLPGKLQ